MTTVVIGLLAVFSICVAAAQADEPVSAGVPPDGNLGGGHMDSFVNPEGLAGVLRLNKSQCMGLQSLKHEF